MINNDALDAIKDIKEALAEYGNTITIKKVTQGAYNTQTGTTSKVVVDIPSKAIVKKYASDALTRTISANTTISTFELSLLVYHTEEIKKDWQIVFKGQTYNILYVSPNELQDMTISYELLIKR
jgi:SPP1 family predicted phage head-tail adaptor